MLFIIMQGQCLFKYVFFFPKNRAYLYKNANKQNMLMFSGMICFAMNRKKVILEVSRNIFWDYA